MFAKPMRDRRCVTMLDPLLMKYGRAVTAVLSLGSLLIDLVLVPLILISLGQYFSTFKMYRLQFISYSVKM